MTLVILITSQFFPLIQPLTAHAAPGVIALIPAAGEALMAVLQTLGVVTAVAGGGYAISQTYPYIADMFKSSGYELQTWIEKTFGDIYYTDGIGNFFVGNSTSFPVTASTSILAHATSLVTSTFNLPVNATGSVAGVPLQFNVNTGGNIYIPLGDTLDKWILPFYQTKQTTIAVPLPIGIYYATQLFYIRGNRTGVDTWAPNASQPVAHDFGYTLTGEVPPFLYAYPFAGGSSFPIGIVYDYTIKNGYPNWISTAFNSTPRLDFERTSGQTIRPYPFTDIAGETIRDGTIYYGKFNETTGTVANDGNIYQTGVITVGGTPSWSTGIKEKSDEIGVAVPEDTIIIIEKVPADPNDFNNDDDDDDKPPQLFPPDWWKIIETILDYVGDDKEYPTTVNYYVTNNFTYNTTVDPSVPVPSDFNVSLDVSGNIHHDVDLDISGGLNIDITINDNTELPSVSEGDGENFFSADALDVFAGLTKNNPVLETLKELFAVVDPALVSIFSVSVSLVLLLALWKFIRG